MYWRCHNREYYLSDVNTVDLYFNTLRKSLVQKKTGEKVQVHAYCAMSNHMHHSMSYENGSNKLSLLMRYCHGIFGAKYNKMHNRSGKVAESRPKTTLIENDEHEMTAQFYIESNPLKAGTISLEQLQFHSKSSFGFYAFGIKTKYSDILTIPAWYLRLGKKPKERQKKYRKLFFEYVKKIKENIISIKKTPNFWGCKEWIELQKYQLKEKNQLKFQNNLQLASLLNSG